MITVPKWSFKRCSSPTLSKVVIAVVSLTTIIDRFSLAPVASRQALECFQFRLEVGCLVVDRYTAPAQFRQELRGGQLRNFGGASERYLLPLIEANGDVYQRVSFIQSYISQPLRWNCYGHCR